MLNIKVSNSFKEDALAHVNLIEKVPYDVNSDRVVMAADIVDNELVGYEVVAEEDYFVVRQLGGAVVDSSDTLKGALIKSADLTYVMLDDAQMNLTEEEVISSTVELMNLLYAEGDDSVRFEYDEYFKMISVGEELYSGHFISNILVKVHEGEYVGVEEGGFLSIEEVTSGSTTHSRASHHDNLVPALNDALENYLYQA